MFTPKATYEASYNVKYPVCFYIKLKKTKDCQNSYLNLIAVN